MFQFRRGHALGVVLAIALFGCGSGGQIDGPEGSVTITGSPELNGYLDSLCTFMVRAGAYPKKLPCAQGIMESAGRTMMDLASAIHAGTVIYHPDLAAQCAAEALSVLCTQIGYDTLWNDCLLAFEATTAADGACHSDFECLAGMTCYGECAGWEVTSCCTGKCTPASVSTSPTTTVFAGDGASCTGASTLCENLTSYCERASGTCQPRLPVGAKCSYDESCIRYAFCNAGACQKRPGLGEKCKLPGGGFVQCLPGGCDQNDTCSTTNFVVNCF